MINKVSISESTKFHPQTENNKENGSSINFKGNKLAAITGAAVAGMQYLERNPMMHVATLDVTTAIGPRTIFDSITNLFAGFETLCRESGGLIINCLIPGFIAIGAGKVLDKHFIKTGAKMADCQADTETIKIVSNTYKEQNGNMPKVYEALLSKIQGIDGDNIVKYSDLGKPELEALGKRLAGAANQEEFNKVIDDIMTKTHVNESIRFGDKGAYLKDTSVSSLLQNTRKYIGEYESSGKAGIENFAAKAEKLVKGKSAIALLLVLPLAASMQFFNRWMTGKLSGVDGAPIYEDFEEAKKHPELYAKIKAKAKEGLLQEKIISIGAMLGMAAASILMTATQRPNLKMLGRMLQFKGKYPTMDQARAISAVTFSSRIAAADDKNEVRESRGRDLLTFGSLYFFGDYGGKAAASVIEARTGVKLLNRTVVSPKDANILTKFKNWVLNTHIKSSNELKFADKAMSSKAQKYRSICQLINLLSSFAILGLIIYERGKTKKKHEQIKAQVIKQYEAEQKTKQEQQKTTAA